MTSLITAVRQTRGLTAKLQVRAMYSLWRASVIFIDTELDTRCWPGSSESDEVRVAVWDTLAFQLADVGKLPAHYDVAVAAILYNGRSAHRAQCDAVVVDGECVVFVWTEPHPRVVMCLHRHRIALRCSSMSTVKLQQLAYVGQLILINVTSIRRRVGLRPIQAKT